jgi:hypothetical protein
LYAHGRQEEKGKRERVVDPNLVGLMESPKQDVGIPTRSSTSKHNVRKRKRRIKRKIIIMMMIIKILLKRMMDIIFFASLATQSCQNAQ